MPYIPLDIRSSNEYDMDMDIPLSCIWLLLISICTLLTAHSSEKTLDVTTFGKCSSTFATYGINRSLTDAEIIPTNRSSKMGLVPKSAIKTTR